MKAEIKAIEYYLPRHKVSNEDLSKEFPDYDFSRFEAKVGVKNRYWVAEDESALDLAVAACEKLFARIDRTSIDYIIYCTQSPEYFLPTTACLLQDKLGVKKSAGAFDFNLGCSGYVYGLSLAKGLIESGQAAHILLVTAETYSKFIHPQDKSNRAIFGDAASATYISAGEQEGLGRFLFGTDGSGADKLIVKNGGCLHPFNPDAELQKYGSDNWYTDNHLYMNGPEVFNFTLDIIPDFTLQVLEKNGLKIEDVDYFVFHQANSFMLNTLRKRLKVNQENFYIDMQEGGNTVSNTIPIALKRLNATMDENQSFNALIVGFGVGLSWAGGLITISGKL